MRIRSIWPAFWTSLTLADLPREVRLAFISLWNYADDEGRERCDYRLLKGALFPLDEDVTRAVLQEWMDQMEAARLLVRYEKDGKLFYAIRSWDEFQKPNKPRKSHHPRPPVRGTEEERTPTGCVEISPAGEGLREGEGKEGSRKGEEVEGKGTEEEELPDSQEGPVDFVTQLKVAANQGLRDNPSLQTRAAEIGQYTRPLLGAEQAAKDWAEIPAEVVLAAITDTCRKFVSTPENPRIGSFRYFDAAVRKAWKERGQGTAEAAAFQKLQAEHDREVAA